MEKAKNCTKNIVSDIIKSNISYLIENDCNPQKYIASKLKVSESTISAYKTGSSKPDIFMLNDIAKYYNITIDEILNYNLREAYENQKENLIDECIPFDSKLYNKFVTQKYYIYYFKKNIEDYLNIGHGEIIFEQNHIKKRCDALIKMDVMSNNYQGNLVLTYRHIYIYIGKDSSYERGLIILNSPPNNPSKPYIGGIGVISSITAGWEKVPCIQKILFSNRQIPNQDKYMNKVNSLLSIPEKTNDIVRIDIQHEQEAYKFIKGVASTEAGEGRSEFTGKVAF